MKEPSSSQSKARSSTRSSTTTTGSGAALMPPAYGVALVDHPPAETDDASSSGALALPAQSQTPSFGGSAGVAPAPPRPGTTGDTAPPGAGQAAYPANAEATAQRDEATPLTPLTLSPTRAQTGAQRPLLQRAPEETKKYAGIIDYEKAKKENLASWYAQYKFYNLFKEEGIYPGSHPIAYANHVYELQMQLQQAYGLNVAGDEASGYKWSPAEPGILEAVITTDSTLLYLVKVAHDFNKDATADHGFDKKLLERINQYIEAFEANPPKIKSELFAGVSQLEAVNRNKLFYIQQGDRGEYVTRIQLALSALNYDIGRDAPFNEKSKQREASGIFGEDTKKALINYQKDSGFTGKQADGILGQNTLRLLDKRLKEPAIKAGAAGGNAIAVDVPVTAADLQVKKATMKDDLLIRSLKIAFPITDDQAKILLHSDWHWTVYHDLTQEDVNRGHTRVTIDKSSFESIMGKVTAESGQPAEMPVEEKLIGQSVDLLKASKLHELNRKIESLEDEIENIRGSGDPEVHGRDVDWNAISAKRAELEGVKKERQQELNRLGITLEQYDKLKSDFIKTFEKFAVRIAFEMLAENELNANIEAGHYKNIDEVKALQAILSDLAAKYKKSEELWWQAVSKEEKRVYKNGTDYEAQNTTFVQQTENDVFSGNPERLYTEANISKMYAGQEKEPSTLFSGWHAQEKEIFSTLKEAAVKYPILAFPKLNLRDYAGTYATEPVSSLQSRLRAIISDEKKGIKPNIQSTREKLAKEPSKIWDLPVVVQNAQYALGLTEGVPAALIKAKQEAVADKSFWENIGLAVLGLGLGLLALVSGPVGWLALGASIAVGTYDAYRTYQEISFKKETAGTALNPADALGTEDPSYFWFWVSLISVGLDVGQAVKLSKSVAKGFHLAKDVTNRLQEAKELAKAKLTKAGAASAEGQALLKEIAEIDSALTLASGSEFAKNFELLKSLKSNPMAVTVMSEALKDKKIVNALTTLGKLVEKELFENVLMLYAGVGRRSLDEAPELVRLIKEGGLEANKPLTKELLSDPRAQRVLLDTQDYELFAKNFNDWSKAVKDGESISFVKYLENAGFSTRRAADTKLIDMFGEAFAKLPNTVKNRQILRTIEPRLLDAFNAGSLPPEITKGLEVLLHSEILAESSRLSSAQARLQRELQLLGGLIETQSDFSKVIALLDSSAARHALWEGATQLAGKENYVALIKQANGGKLPAAEVMDDLIRIGPMKDEETVRSLLSGPGEKLRQALVMYPEAVAVLKKCASACLPPFVTPEQVVEVARIMQGKSNAEVLRIREFLYASRDSEDTFKAALQSLKDNFAGALKDVALPVLSKPRGLAVADETLRAIIDLGMPVTLLNSIMKQAAPLADGPKVITDLFRVLQFENYVKPPNFHILTDALARGNAVEFATARKLLNEASNFSNSADGFRFSGLQKADFLLGRFPLTELGGLMRAKWSGGFVKRLYGVIAKVPGITNDQIVDLIRRAGGKAPGDLERLGNILESIKSSTTTVDEVLKAIDAADDFAAAVAKAMRDPITGYDAMVKLVWGEGAKIEEVAKVEGAAKKIKVKDVLSASTYKTVFPPDGTKSLARLFASQAGIEQEKWKVFRKVIEDADISHIQKNHIIGEMWTQANVEHYRALGYTVLREVEVTNVVEVAKADLVLVKGDEVIIVECKSGEAVYERGQKIIYPLLEKGKFEEVLIKGNEELASKYAKAKRGFIARRESEIIKK